MSLALKSTKEGLIAGPVSLIIVGACVRPDSEAVNKVISPVIRLISKYE